MSTWLKFNDDATGMDYYHNPTTNETRWDRPEDFRDSITEANAWVTFFDDDAQKYYYYNSVTEETSWELPPELQTNIPDQLTESTADYNEEYNETGETRQEIEEPSVPAVPETSHSVTIESVVEEAQVPVSSPVTTMNESNSPNPFGEDDSIDSKPTISAQPASPPSLPNAKKAMSIAPASVRMSVLMHNSATEKGVSAGPKTQAPIAYGTVAEPPPMSKSTSKSSNPFGDDDDKAGGKPSSQPPAKPTKMVIPKAPSVSASAAPAAAPLLKTSSSVSVGSSKNPFGDDDDSTGCSGSAAGKGTYARPPTSNPFGPPDPPSSSSSSGSTFKGTVAKPPSAPPGKFMQTVKKGSPLLATAAPPPPPVAAQAGAITAVPVRGARGTVSPSQLLAANAGTGSSSPENVAVMSNNMKLLIKIGIKPTLADSALRDNGNNWVAALQSINQQLVIAIRADPYNTQLSMWGSRITVRIKSWLPNIMEQNKPDYHTGYVCVVNYSSIYNNKNIHPWQLILRYNSFYKLYCIVCKHLKYTNIKAEFPVATSGHWMFGITDEIRNDRMNKFDTWMRELLVNPILMTTKEIVDAVNSLLEIDSRITE